MKTNNRLLESSAPLREKRGSAFKVIDYNQPWPPVQPDSIQSDIYETFGSFGLYEKLTVIKAVAVSCLSVIVNQ